MWVPYGDTALHQDYFAEFALTWNNDDASADVKTNFGPLIIASPVSIFLVYFSLQRSDAVDKSGLSVRTLKSAMKMDSSFAQWDRFKDLKYDYLIPSLLKCRVG